MDLPIDSTSHIYPHAFSVSARDRAELLLTNSRHRLVHGALRGWKIDDRERRGTEAPQKRQTHFFYWMGTRCARGHAEISVFPTNIDMKTSGAQAKSAD